MNEIANIAFEEAFKISNNLQGELSTIIKGKEETIKFILTALFADGHILLEDYPGSGKTTLAKTLGQLIDCQSNQHLHAFKRIQFTPDLLPGDVLGVNIFDPKSAEFRFQAGPVFSHIVLADEINRTGPKVQAAFLECMAEKQVTIDNQTHFLDELFFVIGTQNPLDLAGTYPLPLVQLDRFLLKVPMTYVGKEIELEILSNHQKIEDKVKHITPICKREDILKIRALLSQVQLKSTLQEAIVKVTQASRNNPNFQFGLSTRSALLFQKGLLAWAIVNNRNYVTEDDFKVLAPYVFKHRLTTGIFDADLEHSFKDLIKPAIDYLVETSLK